MTVVEAIFESGVFRPVSPVELAEGMHVEVLVPEATGATVGKPVLASTSFGIFPHEDAEEISRIIEEEFEQVNLDEWQ